LNIFLEIQVGCNGTGNGEKKPNKKLMLHHEKIIGKNAAILK
jgi:hypothetical protein